MRTKILNFQHAVSTSDYSVVIVVETWLNSEIGDEELGLFGYDVFRLDRDCELTGKKRGGGILIAVKHKLLARRVDIPYSTVEQLFVSICINNQNVIFGGIYIPPSSTIDAYVEHVNAVDYIYDKYADCKLVLCGDYNLPEAIWFNENLGLNVRCPDNSPALVILDNFSFHNLFQVNSISNSRGIFLDLIFSSFSNIIVSNPLDNIFENSISHSAVSFQLTSEQEKYLEYEEYFYDFRNGNYISFNDFLISINWETTLDKYNINLAVEQFYDILYSGINMYVPLKKYKTSTFPGWFSPQLKKFVLDKKRSHKMYKITGDIAYYYQFAALRSQCSQLRNTCFNEYINRTENNISSDPKSFWKYINDKKKSYRLPSVLHYDNKSANNNNDVVNLFSSYFSTIYSNEQVNYVPNYNHKLNCVNISSYSIDIKEIIDHLLHAQDKLSIGPDGIPLYLLKKCLFTIAIPLQILFNLSLNSGIFPCFWKEGFLIPIHKAGPKDNVKNYRAVCNQSEIPKLFDYLISKKLMWDTKSIINSDQHGFLSGRSTTTNLLIYEHFIMEALEQKLQVDSVYTDFTKAFDQVNHDLLIAKLHSFGIDGCVLGWINSYLKNRTQYVKYVGSISSSINVSSGVPQGSHLGPLLFNLFIDDIGQTVKNSKMLMFADDLKLFRIVSSFDDANLLQGDLNSLSLWCDINLLKLNVDKCYRITFHRMNSPVNFLYRIGDHELKLTDTMKDLGVIFDSKMTFKPHFSNIVARALKILGFVIRTSKLFSIDTCKLLYCSLVRNILEYGSIIWNPHYLVDIDRIEKVQIKFLRFSAYKLGLVKENDNYATVLRTLGINSLEHRRLEIDLRFLHKLLNGYVDSSDLLNLVHFNVKDRRTRHSELFSIPFHQTNYGRNEPITRLLRSANIYQGRINLFDSGSLSFKHQIKIL